MYLVDDLPLRITRAILIKKLDKCTEKLNADLQTQIENDVASVIDINENLMQEELAEIIRSY